MSKRKTKLEIECLCSINGILLYKDGDKEKEMEFVSSWGDERIIVTYEANFTRSKAQNRFFHGCIVPAVQRCMSMLGLEKAHSREYIKEVILKKPLLSANIGQDDEYIRPTSSLTIEEFWEFCRRCLDILVHFGGNLNEREQHEYDELIKRYHLDKAIEEVMSFEEK